MTSMAELKSVLSPLPPAIHNPQDADNLANLGYKQEFSRNYDFLSTFSFALSVSGLMGTIAITYLYPLWAGGPAAAVWCWFVGACGCLCIAWSVAEITSCFPTSGGMYFVITHVVPKDYVPLVCWIDGWLFFTGALTGACSTDFGAATLLLQTVSMYKDYTYIPTNGQITAVSILVILSHAMINSLPGSVLAGITKYYCIVNICSTIALIVTMLVKCPEYNTRGFTFGDVVNSTGWKSDGWAFLFGFLQVSWVMTCYDATSRMSEEVNNAAYMTPLAIASALTTTAVLGWVLIIVITLTMGTNLDQIMNTTSGQPIVEIFYIAMGKQAATAYLALCFVILWFCGAVAMCYTARSLWSFSRDRGLPYYKFWYHLEPKTEAPIRCVWLIFIINSLLTLINLGSTTAMNAIFSACAICTDWSYIIAIAAFALNREKMGIPRGPFHLGKLSKPIMFYACTWTVFVSIVFIFPNYMPVTKENMNYTIVIIGFVFIFAGGWYAIDAKNWYKGPVSTIDEVDEGSIEVRSGDAFTSGSSQEKVKAEVNVEPVSSFD
ncbi:Bio5 protein [Martiniozyma asiatica (nom. inval.)]|nr:Bio5 protein [Martiniozyma asiatica]